MKHNINLPIEKRDEIITKGLTRGLLGWKKYHDYNPDEIGMSLNNNYHIKQAQFKESVLYINQSEGKEIITFKAIKVFFNKKIPDNEAWVFIDREVVAIISLKPDIEGVY